ncbi:MAG: FKBP-type peptidyl-prolyl cis-trans isomerase [Chitinophagaceae bacterium]|nr:FKBP-type peptidyl-prolyl cis-trans isomerase [Chitinophagaceae bacterium]MCW5904479.1 FKBP-type peptidyl-prolyl cis-trans isomerase [Chitinophagaceae bacterium]
MKKLLTITVAASLLLGACSQYEKTPTGMPYKITKGPRKQKIAQGDFIKMNFEYKLKDSLIAGTFGHIPIYLSVDTLRKGRYNFSEVITDCYIGDKMTFTMSIDSMVKNNVVAYNNVFKKGDFITGKVEYLKKFADQAEQEKDFNQEVEAQKQREKKEVKDYAAKNKYKAIYTENGVGVVIEKEGTDTIKPQNGQVISVYYTGKLMSNGKEFDGNVKDGKPVGKAFSFPLGSGSVIAGWDEGLRLFTTGSKGKLLIPASLAYGMMGSPPVIPTFANLVFDVEVVSIKDKAALEPIEKK